MQATDVLSEEHRVIENVLNSLEKGANSLERGQAVSPEFFISATDFIRGFADGCHHHKEEGVLFMRMEENGMPVQGSPIGVMLSEHELGRQYTRGMRSAAEALQTGDSNAKRKIIENARDYITLLRQHIYKEDNILFPLANEVIPVDQYDSVRDGFEHVEHEESGEGVHEKYLALAQAIEKEAEAFSR